MNNAQEYLYGTLPWESDTDEDGLSDGDEVLVYGTDPLKPDTDGDGLIDGDEPAMGFDPTKPDTDENGIPDGKNGLNRVLHMRLRIRSVLLQRFRWIW